MTEYASENTPQIEQPATTISPERKPRHISNLPEPAPAALQLMMQSSVLGQNKNTVAQRAVRKPKTRQSVAANSGDKPKFELFVPASKSYSGKSLKGRKAFNSVNASNAGFISSNMPRGYALRLEDSKWQLVGPVGTTVSDIDKLLADFRLKGKVKAKIDGPAPRPDPNPKKEEKEIDYTGIKELFEEPDTPTPKPGPKKEEKEIDYTGIKELFEEPDTPTPKPGPKKEEKEIDYTGIKELFEEPDTPTPKPGPKKEEKEIDYTGIKELFEEPDTPIPKPSPKKEEKEIDYTGIKELFEEPDTPAPKPGPKKEEKEIDYTGIKELFDETDPDDGFVPEKKGFAPKISTTYLDNEGNVTRTDDADQTLTALGKVKRVEFEQLGDYQQQAVGNASTLRERVNSLETAAALDVSVANGLYGAPVKIAAASAAEALAQGAIDWSQELVSDSSAFSTIRGLLKDAGLGKEDFPKLLDSNGGHENSETDEVEVPEKATARERLEPYSSAARQVRQALGYTRAGELWNDLKGYSNAYQGLAGNILKSEALKRRNTLASSLKPSLVKTASNGGVAINASALSVYWLGDKAHKDFWSGEADAL